MTEQPPPPATGRIREMLTGFWMSKALFTGVELGIFDELTKGPASAEVLAYRLRLHPGALERLMNALVAMGLLEREASRYRNAPEAETSLVKGLPTYVGGQVEHLSQLHWRLWQHLPDAIRENSPRVKQVFGPGFDILETAYAEPQRLRSFVQGMHNLTVAAAEEIVEAFNLSGYTCLMDVGGGSGALAIAAARRYAHLRGIIFELPAVCAVAQDYIEQHGLTDRVRTHAGDFFETASMPQDADVIALGWVLHDWPAGRCRTILRHCFEALNPGGTMLVCEKLLDESRTGPLQATLMDLHALVSTGGQERPASIYEGMLEAAGFERIESRLLEGNRDLVIGHKPDTPP